MASQRMLKEDSIHEIMYNDNSDKKAKATKNI